MRKKILLTTALLSVTLAAGSLPMTSHAAEAGIVRELTGSCYNVYIGQGTGSLCRVLEKICAAIGSSGNLYPEAPAPETPAPEAPAPEKPNPPAADTPETPAPETPAPETPALPDEALSYTEQIVKLVNEERAKAGLPALTMDEGVTAAANVRAREIKQKFAHTRPDGKSFSSALKEQGVSFRGSGENIAWGQKSPEQVMNAWMNSDGHRANILNRNFKNIGVGYYQDEKGVNYWVQLFSY